MSDALEAARIILDMEKRFPAETVPANTLIAAALIEAVELLREAPALFILGSTAGKVAWLARAAKLTGDKP